MGFWGYLMFGEGLFDIFSEENKQKHQQPTDVLESMEGAPNSLDAKKTFVISLGGSVVVDEKLDTTLLAKLASVIESMHNSGYEFAIVVGGGKTARNYIQAAKIFGANNFALDMIGILSTRLNAMIAVQAIEKTHPNVLTDITRAKEIIAQGKIPVFGGIVPGFTTDAVSALIAEQLNASFINLSNVAGIYSADPRKNPDAELYTKLSHKKLLKVIVDAVAKTSGPGQNVILDLPCALILQRSNIRALVLNAHDVSNFENAVRDLDFHGTTIE